MVGRAAEDVGEAKGRIAVAGADPFGEGGGGGDAASEQLLGERDRVAARRQRNERDERFSEPRPAEVAGERHSGERVTGVELPEGKLVADIPPADLAIESDGDGL